MRIQSLAALLLIVGGAHSFSSPQVVQTRSSSSSSATSLQAQRNDNNGNDWMGPVAVTAMGWALASQVAVAGMLNPMDTTQQQQLQPFIQQQPTTTYVSTSTLNVAAEVQLDFSLPSYDSIGKSQGGFGVGTEARIGQTDSLMDPGSNEKAKQQEAMKKAEEARLAQKKQKQQAMRDREEEELRRQEEKKAEGKKRMEALFS